MYSRYSYKNVKVRERLHEQKTSWLTGSLAKLLGRSPKPAPPLPTNCPPTDANKKEQVYWFGFERDEIDELCDPPKPPLHKCRKKQILMAEQCGCLPRAQLCDSTRVHYPGIIKEIYSTKPLIYRRCEPKPRHPPKPPLPPAVRCIQLACSTERWLPLSERSTNLDCPNVGCLKDASEAYGDPYDEFNYVERQRRAKRNAEISLNKYCSGNV